MLMMTTVRFGPDSVGVKAVGGGGGVLGIHILGPPHFFLNRGPAWNKSALLVYTDLKSLVKVRAYVGNVPIKRCFYPVD